MKIIMNDELQECMQNAVAYFRLKSQHVPGGTDRNNEMYFGSRCLRWHLNPGPAEYELLATTRTV